MVSRLSNIRTAGGASGVQHWRPVRRKSAELGAQLPDSPLPPPTIVSACRPFHPAPRMSRTGLFLARHEELEEDRGGVAVRHPAQTGEGDS